MRPTLFFLYMHGCSACAEAKGPLDKFEQAHPEIEVKRVDLTETDWPEGDIEGPDSVPSYALMEGDRVARTVMGRPLKLHELERWVRGW